MLDKIMSSHNFDYLSRGLEASSLRHEIISHNIANVNTPKFKRSSVQFEDLLAKEIQPPDDKYALALTHDKHMRPDYPPKRAVATVHLEDDDTMRVDGNNVDIDMEMANLAKNQLYYNALATQLKGYVRKLKEVITSGQS
ncbi:MAG: flagellar basal body rod protein FlgB [Selenomonadaceae bacterium]|nr:flagellar basal body rod protein FlgB [Selenomonadaceae bacterium]